MPSPRQLVDRGAPLRCGGISAVTGVEVGAAVDTVERASVVLGYQLGKMAID